MQVRWMHACILAYALWLGRFKAAFTLKMFQAQVAHMPFHGEVVLLIRVWAESTCYLAVKNQLSCI